MKKVLLKFLQNSHENTCARVYFLVMNHDHSPMSSLREKYPNTVFFLVRIFPHSDWIQRDTSYLSIFSPNAGKYRPGKTPYLDNFHAVVIRMVHKTMLATVISRRTKRFFEESLLNNWVESQSLNGNNL